MSVGVELHYVGGATLKKRGYLFDYLVQLEKLYEKLCVGGVIL